MTSALANGNRSLCRIIKAMSTQAPLFSRFVDYIVEIDFFDRKKSNRNHTVLLLDLSKKLF